MTSPEEMVDSVMGEVKNIITFACKDGITDDDLRGWIKQILFENNLAIIKGAMPVPLCCSECQCQNLFHAEYSIIPLEEEK